MPRFSGETLRVIAMTILSCAPVICSSFGLAAAQGVDEIVAHAGEPGTQRSSILSSLICYMASSGVETSGDLTGSARKLNVAKTNRDMLAHGLA